MKVSFALLALAVTVGAGPAMAANARNPYGNVDRRVDAGNDTGDSQVEWLNRQQLGAAPRPAPMYAPPPQYAPYPYPPYGYAPAYPPPYPAPYPYYRPY